jgi:hypothetical protein
LKEALSIESLTQLGGSITDDALDAVSTTRTTFGKVLELLPQIPSSLSPTNEGSAWSYLSPCESVEERRRRVIARRGLPAAPSETTPRKRLAVNGWFGSNVSIQYYFTIFSVAS